MYHCGGERGWHHGHQQRDSHPPRNHRSRPYRGGYHDHREHDNYGPYHDNSSHDRNYHDSHAQSYPEYYEENQSFNEYREHREPAYNRGGRHDSGYHKETYYHGSYQRGRGKPTRHWGSIPETPHKKSSPKSVKAHKYDIYMKSSTPQPLKKVTHNSGPTIVTLTPGITEDASETKFSKAKSPEQDAKPSQDFEKTLQETAKLECGKKDDVKVDHVVKEMITSPTDRSNDSLSACNIKTEVTESKKEDTFKTEQTVKVEEELMKDVNPGKRAHSEEKDLDASLEQREGESFVAKRLCVNKDRDEHHLEKTVDIPLLDCWREMPSESAVSASTSEQEHTGSAVNCELPDTARELRTAFILARKQQIEVAFAQDCKTFAFVASTLLKKDPSIEASVTSALRSSLQEMSGLCVQELNTFIDRYDSGV